MGQKRAAASLCHPPIPLADPAFPPAIAFDSDATLCSCSTVRASMATTGKVWPADRIESRSDRLDRTTERIARYVSRLGLESRDTCSNDSAFGFDPADESGRDRSLWKPVASTGKPGCRAHQRDSAEARAAHSNWPTPSDRQIQAKQGGRESRVSESIPSLQYFTAAESICIGRSADFRRCRVFCGLPPTWQHRAPIWARSPTCQLYVQGDSIPRRL